MAEGHKNCSHCGQLLPLDNFYFVSRSKGTRRGQCKPCMAEIKAAQRDPNWKPKCSRCGAARERSGMGRRLCDSCFNETYDAESPRGTGSHNTHLKPCTGCGDKRLRADQVKNASLCPICRSVPQSRRSSLKRYFNMSPKDFLLLQGYQGHVCAICKKKPRKSINVDHRHSEPSIVRGLVCSRCNTLLGMARDNSEVLSAAAEYLNDPPAQRIMPGLAANDIANRFSPPRYTRQRSRQS